MPKSSRDRRRVDSILDSISWTKSNVPAEHEEAFQHFYLVRSADRVRIGMIAGAFIFVMATVADLKVLPEGVLLWSVPARLGLAVPLLLGLSWVAGNPSRYRLHFSLAIAVCAVAGIVVSAIVLHLQLLDEPWDMQRVCLVTFAFYVVSGLRSKTASLLGGLLFVGVLGFEILLGYGSRQVIRSLVSLTSANLLGATAAFAMEESIRSDFLTRLRLTHMAERDGLTSLFNRRHLDEHLERVHRQAARDQNDIAVALIDVDHFKRFNDTQGHAAGDECLRDVAESLRLCANRPFDIVARYGGEEFCVVWYGPERDSLPHLAEACRKAVADLEVPHPASDVASHITVSCGVAVGSAEHESVETLMLAADEALYKAKELGRNQWVIHSLGPS